jgi:nucleotide-binding universal stress UspA family protein
MPIKTILCPIVGGEADASTMNLAAAVARKFGAHVDIVHAKADPRDSMPYLGEGASPALIDQVLDSAEKEGAVRAGRAQEEFEAWRATSGLPVAAGPGTGGASCAYRAVAGAEDKWIARLGRVADLTVVGQPRDGGTVAAMLAFEAALLDTGHPVLIAPAAGGGSLDGSALVAWNGSVESARAVTAGLPLLAGARAVSVVTVEENANLPDGKGCADLLAWHGIRADVRSLGGKGRTAAQAIVAEIEATKAGFLVMGGYTHNRLRQMIFGGVTALVLKSTTIPVLMAH